MGPFGLAAAAAAIYGNPNIPLPGPPSFGSVGEGLIPIPIMYQAKPELHEGFYLFQEGIPCPDQCCIYLLKKHYHCSQPRCFYATDRSDILIRHSKNFHDIIDIMEAFVFFDRSVDCRRIGCSFNKQSRHFHCTRNGCNYSFIQYADMTTHDREHREQDELKNKEEKDLNIS